LRVHSVPDAINMVHQSSSNVCDPLLNGTENFGLVDGNGTLGLNFHQYM
jgi:hypothetical protein